MLKTSLVGKVCEERLISGATMTSKVVRRKTNKHLIWLVEIRTWNVVISGVRPHFAQCDTINYNAHI